MLSRIRRWGEERLGISDEQIRREREIDELGLSEITTKELKDVKKKFPDIVIEKRQKPRERFAYVFLKNNEGDIAYKRYEQSSRHDHGHWYLIVEHHDPEITGPRDSQQPVLFAAIIDNLDFLQKAKIARGK